jgi:hypothetical protein
MLRASAEGGATAPDHAHQPAHAARPEPRLPVVEELARRMFALPGVEEPLSVISVPRARAMCLSEGAPEGPREGFMIGREFAHIHPVPDGSLHAALPPEVAEEAVEKG